MAIFVSLTKLGQTIHTLGTLCSVFVRRKFSEGIQSSFEIHHTDPITKDENLRDKFLVIHGIEIY